MPIAVLRRLLCGFWLFVLAPLTVAAEPYTPFFPLGTWGPPNGNWSPAKRALFFEHWFGGALLGLEESPISANVPETHDGFVLRLLVLPSFHPATSLRLSGDATGVGDYVFKQSDGPAGYQAIGLDQQETGRFAPEMVEALRQNLAVFAAPGGRMPALAADPFICLDGAGLVLEYADRDRRAAYFRHQCELSRSDPFWQLADVLDRGSGGKVLELFRSQYGGAPTDDR